MNQKIQLIAIDQDRTLLDSNGRLSGQNKRAIHRATKQGLTVIIATGKSVASARGVLADLGLPLTGVFSQGLVLYDAGQVIHEIGLARETAVSTITFAETQQLPIIAYCGERMLTDLASPYSDLLHTHYQEPAAEVIGSLLGWVDRIRMNKLLISDEVNTATTRAALEKIVDGKAEVVQAVPEFLEVLPVGTSKGGGLAHLLARWQINPAVVMAIGDGENDIEMLQMAGLGVAMGNADAAVQATADVVVASNDENGVAEAIRRFVLQD